MEESRQASVKLVGPHGLRRSTLIAVCWSLLSASTTEVSDRYDSSDRYYWHRNRCVSYLDRYYWHRIRCVSYLGEGEFTDDATRVIVDGDFAVMLHPALSSEDVVDTWRCLVPRVLLIIMPWPTITTLLLLLCLLSLKTPNKPFH